jgi:hypothetical protein
MASDDAIRKHTEPGFTDVTLASLLPEGASKVTTTWGWIARMLVSYNKSGAQSWVDIIDGITGTKNSEDPRLNVHSKRPNTEDIKDLLVCRHLKPLLAHLYGKGRENTFWDILAQRLLRAARRGFVVVSPHKVGFTTFNYDAQLLMALRAFCMDSSLDFAPYAIGLFNEARYNFGYPPKGIYSIEDLTEHDYQLILRIYEQKLSPCLYKHLKDHLPQELSSKFSNHSLENPVEYTHLPEGLQLAILSVCRLGGYHVASRHVPVESLWQSRDDEYQLPTVRDDDREVGNEGVALRYALNVIITTPVVHTTSVTNEDLRDYFQIHVGTRLYDFDQLVHLIYSSAFPSKFASSDPTGDLMKKELVNHIVAYARNDKLSRDRMKAIKDD